MFQERHLTSRYHEGGIDVTLEPEEVMAVFPHARGTGRVGASGWHSSGDQQPLTTRALADRPS